MFKLQEYDIRVRTCEAGIQCAYPHCKSKVNPFSVTIMNDRGNIAAQYIDICEMHLLIVIVEYMSLGE